MMFTLPPRRACFVKAKAPTPGPTQEGYKMPPDVFFYQMQESLREALK